MTTIKLKQQFMKLWDFFDGNPIPVTLDELSTQIGCSRRHMRTLLNKMEQSGWIKWHAFSGRSRRSNIEFLIEAPILYQDTIRELLENNCFDQAIRLTGENKKLNELFTEIIRKTNNNTQSSLNILYYRSLIRFLPGSYLQRSEKNLIRQIFNGLTRINDSSGHPEPDISHHWEQLTATHWRFYIRPGIRFHHGRELNVQDIISSLKRALISPLYSNICFLVKSEHLTLDIKLKNEEKWLLWLLAGEQAMIIPEEFSIMENFKNLPVGTGAYQVVSNSDHLLKLRAFDHYFGFRALIDEINILVMPEIVGPLEHHVHFGTKNDEKKIAESRLEEGCYFLLFDQRSPLCSRQRVRSWLCEVLSPIPLLSYADPLYYQHWSPATGLLPSCHIIKNNRLCDKPSEITSVHIAIFRNHSEHHELTDIIRKTLSLHNIELVIHEISYDDWATGNFDADIWLGSANFPQPVDFSVFSFFIGYPLFSKASGEDWTIEKDNWRRGKLCVRNWIELLINRNTLLPLFHNRLILQENTTLRGVHMNALGWFDFKSVWNEPPYS
ncbi:HTH-type transcriptional regulator SgrR [Pectobacterium brasiliense]|uniref:HTH-type transcriptional regulator SgrR n=1 Tax=Pectobacterium brasiliense TaxID=180957 RepID=UPI003670DFE2